MAISFALIPVFIILILGYTLRRFNFLSEPLSIGIEKMTYFIFFPVLLISNLMNAPLQNLHSALDMALALVGSVLVIAILLIAVRRYLPVSGAEFTSIFQGCTRFNSYIGLAMAVILLPDQGTVLAAVAFAAMIPLLNVLCVMVLAHYASDQDFSWSRTLLNIVKNPLIIACAIGLGINFSGLIMPDSIARTLEILGRATLPLGLLTVGAGLCFSNLLQSRLSLILSVVVKLFCFPFITWLFCLAFGLDNSLLLITLLFAALPSATSAYILARQMKGDHVLMANILTLQSVCAAFSLPFVLGFVR